MKVPSYTGQSRYASSYGGASAPQDESDQYIGKGMQALGQGIGDFASGMASLAKVTIASAKTKYDEDLRSMHVQALDEARIETRNDPIKLKDSYETKFKKLADDYATKNISWVGEDAFKSSRTGIESQAKVAVRDEQVKSAWTNTQLEIQRSTSSLAATASLAKTAIEVDDTVATLYKAREVAKVELGKIGISDIAINEVYKKQELEIRKAAIRGMNATLAKSNDPNDRKTFNEEIQKVMSSTRLTESEKMGLEQYRVEAYKTSVETSVRQNQAIISQHTEELKDERLQLVDAIAEAKFTGNLTEVKRLKAEFAQAFKDEFISEEEFNKVNKEIAEAMDTASGNTLFDLMRAYDSGKSAIEVRAMAKQKGKAQELSADDALRLYSYVQSVEKSDTGKLPTGVKQAMLQLFNSIYRPMDLVNMGKFDKSLERRASERWAELVTAMNKNTSEDYTGVIVKMAKEDGMENAMPFAKGIPITMQNAPASLYTILKEFQTNPKGASVKYLSTIPEKYREEEAKRTLLILTSRLNYYNLLEKQKQQLKPTAKPANKL